MKYLCLEHGWSNMNFACPECNPVLDQRLLLTKAPRRVAYIESEFGFVCFRYEDQTPPFDSVTSYTRAPHLDFPEKLDNK